MKILLIGAGGVGSVISRYLSRNKGISEIVCASKNPNLARKFVDTKNRKIRLTKLDASDAKRVAKAAKGACLIINAGSYKLNEKIMEAALMAGTNYQDLASFMADGRTPEQLKFQKNFQKAGLVGLIDTGIAPGISNLLAAEGAEKLDKVDEIRFRLVEEQKASELIFSWSAEMTLDSLISSPLEYRSGRIVLLKPFSGAEDYEFGPPFGKKRVFNICAEEVATIPRFLKVKKVDFKSSGGDIEFARALYRLGLFNKRAVTVGKEKVVPVEFFSKIAPKVPSPLEMMRLIKSGVIENAVFHLAVEVLGTESGRKIKIRTQANFPDLKEIAKIMPGATYISYPTGVAAAAFAGIIPKIGKCGVFPPEALSSGIRKELLIELESRGITVGQQFSKI